MTKKALKSLLIVFLSVSTLIGCVPQNAVLKPAIEGVRFTEAETPPQGYGGVYVFRPLFSQYLSDEIVRISVGDEALPDLPFGTYTYQALKPGDYELSLSPAEGASALWHRTHSFEIVSGKNTYIAVWASEQILQHMEMMFVAPAVVVPVVSHGKSRQEVLLETASEEMVLPMLSECIRVDAQ